MSDLSPLEKYYPRLLQEIMAFWGAPSCYAQLQGLLMDNRGNREGFPEAVYSDLSMLLVITARDKSPYDIWQDALD